MINTNTTGFQDNLLQYMKQAILHDEAVNVVTEDGNVVLISEEEYKSLLETLYLSSNSKVKKEIIDGLNTPLKDCVPAEEVEW